MASFFFTFGFDHTHPETGASLARKYIEIKGPSEGACRSEMFRRFGNKWSMEYTSKAEAGVDRYGLTCLAVIEVPDGK